MAVDIKTKRKHFHNLHSNNLKHHNNDIYRSVYEVNANIYKLNIAIRLKSLETRVRVDIFRFPIEGDSFVFGKS